MRGRPARLRWIEEFMVLEGTGTFFSFLSWSSSRSTLSLLLSQDERIFWAFWTGMGRKDSWRSSLTVIR
jgi:hypothetical protein